MKAFHRHLAFLVMAMGIAMLLASCAGTPTIDSADTTQQTMRYRIAPGDQLAIYVRDNPKLSVTVPVRPDGRISMPLVQSTMAAGKTPDELAKELEGALHTYIKSPMVTVIVKNFVGNFNQQVRVVGQAVKPMAVPYRRGMTLLDVMIDVGGLTRFAAGNDAKIVRHLPNNSKRTINVNLGDLMDGNVDDNVAMRPGDILIIPQSMF